MNDIFISYAHIDDQVLTDGQKGWITQFHRVLDVRLSQLLGVKPKIWRDPKIQGNDVFDDKIVSSFKDAKVMVSIMSPRYLRSEWCMKELNEFYDAASEAGGVVVGEKSRIIKVIKTPFDLSEIPDRIPPILKSVMGFQFFEHESETGRLVEYDERFGERARQNYFSRIYDLAYEICDLIKDIEGHSGSEGSPDDAENFKHDGLTVYLAEVTSDILGERNRIARELKERGHRVLPDKQMPDSASDIRSELSSLLETCDFSVHLVGDRYGAVPEDADKSTVELQNEIAAEVCKKHELERLIWIANNRSEDTRQTAFLAKLEEDLDAQLGAEVIGEPIDNFKGYLLERINSKKDADSSEVQTQEPSGVVDSKSIYLICDAKDEDAVEPIEDFLFDLGFDVSLPLFEGNEADVAEAHRNKLIFCTSAIVYYGAGSRSWVETKLMDLIQAPGYGRTNPFAAKCVLVDEPVDRRKLRFRSHVAEVLNLTESNLETSLAEFVLKSKDPNQSI